ncbi:MAG TPA: ATP-dependent helicase [Acidimicrobiales bacterium]
MLDESADGATLPAGLTAAQREAVTAPDPLLCVLAGAGAGKTRVLTLRVAWRVHEGRVDPDRVLVCTFSRKAAEELGRRLWALQVGDGVRAGTFHRTALSLLRQHRADRGLAPPSLLADRRGLLTTVLAEPQREVGDRRVARHVLVAQLDTEIGWAKAQLVRPGTYAARARAARRHTVLPAEQIADLFERYEAARRHRRCLDFDDLLSGCADLLHDDARFADAVRWRFRHLFVDEMQDVNPAQFRLLAALLGDEPDLMVVGDPNQSVYGWNGADPSLLADLPALLPGMRVVRLDENHRCTPQIVAVASAALGVEGQAEGGGRTARPTSSRPDGAVPIVTAHDDDDAEAEWVAHQAWLARGPGRRWSDIAVLARTNAQLGAVTEAFARARIPVRRAGPELGPNSDVHRPTVGWSGEPTAPDVEGLGTAAPRRSWASQLLDEADEDAVVLATFHRAKGLQWPTVFVIGLSVGLVPIASARDERALAEERRLLYVALTRAEEQLVCTWAGRSGAGSSARKPSPWLDPIERAAERLRRQTRPLGPRDAAARLGALRALLEPSAGADEAAAATDETLR